MVALNPPVFNCSQTFMYINKTTPILNSIFHKFSSLPLSEILLFFPELVHLRGDMIRVNWDFHVLGRILLQPSPHFLSKLLLLLGIWYREVHDCSPFSPWPTDESVPHIQPKIRIGYPVGAHDNIVIARNWQSQRMAPFIAT